MTVGKHYSPIQAPLQLFTQVVASALSTRKQDARISLTVKRKGAQPLVPS